jgi:hypothetical protein
MNSRIDPPTALREENTPRLGRHSVRNRIRAKLGFESREMLHKKSGQESIFSKREQILLVQGINVGFGILFDDPIGDDDWTTFVCGTNAVEGETTWQTGDGAEQALEGF